MRRLITLMLVACACRPSVDLGLNTDASSGGGPALGGGSANSGGGTASTGGGSAQGGGFATGGGSGVGGGASADGGGTAELDSGVDAGIDGGIDAGLDAGAVAAINCTPEGWCWNNPTPLGTTWYSVWVANDDEAWAVGEAGLAYHYLKGTWSLVPTGTQNTLFTVYGFAPDDVWAGGAGGVGIHWDGMRWSPAGISTDGENIRSLWGTDSANLWAGGAAPQNLSTAEADFFDGGGWKFNFTDCSGSITGIWGSTADDVWFNCQNGGGLQHFTGDRVDSATNIDPGVIAASGLWGSAANSYWAGGANGQLLHFDGGTWSIAATVPATIAQLWGTSDSDFWAVAAGGILHFSSATQFTQQALPPVAAVTALHGSSPTNVWAVGAQNTLLHYDGGSWASSPAGVTQQPAPTAQAIWAASPDDAWLIGTKTISHWDGGTWTTVVPSLPSWLYVIDGAAPNDIWSVGGPNVMHYDGHSWAEHSEGLDGGALWNIWPAGNGEAYASDNGRQLSHYTPATGWTPAYTLPVGGYTDGPNGLWGSGPDDVWFGGGNGTVRWNGMTWSPFPGSNAPQHASLIWGSSPTDVYVYWSDTVFHYNGTTWTHLPELDTRYVHGVTMSGPNDIWLVDFYALSWALVTADHWDGVRWTSIPMPVIGAATIATAGPHFVWGVGWDDQILYMRH